VPLTGIEIFKLLPKTNCSECGVPTCLAFAMSLAAGKAELDACPYVSEEAKAQLSEASAPPIATVTIGTGLVVSQPTAPLGGGATVISPTATVSAVEQVRKFMEIGGTAGDLVTALNLMQVTPRDIIAIFQALKEAGALAAELRIM